MFDLGWSEMAVIAVLALIVIGPKDLPKVLRTVGKWVRTIRSLGGEFQRQMDDVMRESGADDVRRQIRDFSREDLGKKIDRTIDPDGKLTDELRRSPGARPAPPAKDPAPAAGTDESKPLAPAADLDAQARANAASTPSVAPAPSPAAPTAPDVAAPATTPDVAAPATTPASGGQEAATPPKNG